MDFPGSSSSRIPKGKNDPGETDEWLGLPEGCPTCALIPIGWPRGTYRRPVRRSIDECLFVDRYLGTTGGGDAPS